MDLTEQEHRQKQEGSTMKLNENIAALRKKKGLTQEELAQVFGVTNQAVSKWESSVSHT